MHLSKDIEHLSRVTGKGIEESALIVHLVLHRIFTIEPPPNCERRVVLSYSHMHLYTLLVNYAADARSLSTKEGRRAWEDAFNVHYIRPILEHLDQMLTGALNVVASDATQGNNNACATVK